MPKLRSRSPILRCKQAELDVQDLTGLLRINWKVGSLTLYSAFYTRIDQIFVVWGVICFAIFATAQFAYISWHVQAIVWSIATVLGSACMTRFAWYWVRVESLRWVVYLWGALMCGGLAVTDYSIFAGWGPGLVNLCPLWLGLSALGYVVTGIGMQSRTFGIAGALHGLGIAVLSWAPDWQFGLTGAIVAGTLLFLAEVQWDMRSPQVSTVLTEAERAFNQQQQRLREQLP
ncbi:MAG: hypothetical protein AAFY57_14745 [Cyanobacteria bacterium J06642_2]